MTKTIPKGYKQSKVGVIPEGWGRCELIDLIEIKKNKFNPKTSNENKKCIELEHIEQKKGIILGFTNSKEQQSIKNIFKKKQILFGKLRPYLKKYWKAEFEGVCSSEIWVLDGKKTTNDYLFYLIQTDKFNQIANISTGSKMPRSDWKYMAEIPFNIPPKPEQQKIAEILSTWDKAINKQNALIQKKQTLKKGLMQQLLTGKTRFAGFSEDWQEVRLGDISTIKTGNSNREDSTSNKGKYTFFDRSQDIRTSDIFLFDGEAIIVAGEGQEFIPKYFVGKFDLHQRTYAVMEFGFNSGKFLFYYLYQNRKYFYSQAVGSTVKSLRLPMFIKMQIKLPPFKEQQKIAEVLSSADNEINLLKTELTALETQKKGLMQQLLTGKVRVKI